MRSKDREHRNLRLRLDRLGQMGYTQPEMSSSRSSLDLGFIAAHNGRYLPTCSVKMRLCGNASLHSQSTAAMHVRVTRARRCSPVVSCCGQYNPACLQLSLRCSHRQVQCNGVFCFSFRA
jgi:hypothetical protein